MSQPNLFLLQIEPQARSQWRIHGGSLWQMLPQTAGAPP